MHSPGRLCHCRNRRKAKSLDANNIALGDRAGSNLITGSNNIVIGAGVLGTAGESNTTRIGKTTQEKTFISGISGKTVASSVGVIINLSGQLGTIQSSARFKNDIKPMAQSSEALLKLKPVTFRYKEELDPEKIPQFGLIAEQGEKIDPDLVVNDEDGKVSTVRYEAVNAMLLNELLKEHTMGSATENGNRGSKIDGREATEANRSPDHGRRKGHRSDRPPDGSPSGDSKPVAAVRPESLARTSSMQTACLGGALGTGHDQLCLESLTTHKRAARLPGGGYKTTQKNDVICGLAAR